MLPPLSEVLSLSATITTTKESFSSTVCFLGHVSDLPSVAAEARLKLAQEGMQEENVRTISLGGFFKSFGYERGARELECSSLL